MPLSEANLTSTVFEQASEAVLVVDAERKIIRVNPAAERMFGYDRGEMLGQSAQVIYASAGAFEDNGQDRLAKTHDGAAEAYTMTFVRRDGASVTADVVTRALRDGGRIVGYLSTMRDLSQTTRRNRLLMDVLATCSAADIALDQKIDVLLYLGRTYFGMDLGIASHIEEGVYNVLRVSGGEPDIAPGRVFALKDTFCEQVVASSSVVAFTSAEEAGLVEHPCYVQTGLESYIGTPLIVAGRRYGTLNFSSPARRAGPFYESDLSVVMTLAGWIGQEIALEEARTRLREDQERFRRIYQRTPGMHHAIDADGNLVAVSDDWLACLGYDAEEVLGRPSLDVFEAESAARARDVELPRLRRTGHCAAIPFVLLARDGSRVEVELTARSGEGFRGQAYLYADLTDVTRRNEEIRSLNARVDSLLAAHAPASSSSSPARTRMTG